MTETLATGAPGLHLVHLALRQHVAGPVERGLAGVEVQLDERGHRFQLLAVEVNADDLAAGIPVEEREVILAGPDLVGHARNGVYGEPPGNVPTVPGQDMSLFGVLVRGGAKESYAAASLNCQSLCIRP